MRHGKTDPALSAFVVIGTVAYVAFATIVGSVSILLIWLTARRRKNWAKWTFSILSVLGIVSNVWAYFTSALTGADIVGISPISSWSRRSITCGVEGTAIGSEAAGWRTRAGLRPHEML